MVDENAKKAAGIVFFVCVWYNYVEASWALGIPCRSCSEIITSGERSQKVRKNHLLFLLFLFLLLFFLVIFLSTSLTSGLFLLTLRSLGVASLLAWPLSEPLGQTSLGSLCELVVMLLPQSFQHLGPDNLPAALVQLLAVAVGTGVGTSLVLGEHTDLGRVLASEGLWVETLLQGLVSQLNLLSLLQLLELVVLGQTALLEVVLVSLQSHNGVPERGSLVLQLIGVHDVEVEGLDSDGQRDLHLLLDLLLGLGHLSSGVQSGGLLLLATLLLLCSHHLLPLSLCLLEHLLLLLGFLGPLL